MTVFLTRNQASAGTPETDRWVMSATINRI